MKKIALLTIPLVFSIALSAQEPTRYMEPAKELLDIIDAPTTPSLSVNPTKDYVAFSFPQEMPDIADLAQTELRLAGLRIDRKSVV